MLLIGGRCLEVIKLLMPNNALPRQIRAHFDNAPDAPHHAEILELITEYIKECKVIDDGHEWINTLDAELRAIHEGAPDSLQRVEILLDILHILSPVLSWDAFVTWFYSLIKPALQNPKLATTSVNCAKELIISGLQKTDGAVADFRRQILDYYLHGAFNEASEQDVTQWAELNETERQKQSIWKRNLEEILVDFGNRQPEDLLDEIDRHFQSPTTRLQLLSLLNAFTCGPSFEKVAIVLTQRPLLRSLKLSLFLDNSSTACTLGLTLMVKLLPFFAVHARDTLRDLLPELFAILARIMCWKERRASRGRIVPEGGVDIEFERDLERETNPVLTIDPNIKWERLDMMFSATISNPPSSRPYFTILYYLYPSNTLKFLRSPATYLNDVGASRPYVESWETAFDEAEVHRRSENLAREHNCHPLLVWRDAVIELSQPEFWTKYPVNRIVSEAAMLDLRNLTRAIVSRYTDEATHQPSLAFPESPVEDQGEGPLIPQPQFMRPIDLSSGRAVLSLQDMINTTLALKTNLDVEVEQPTGHWPLEVFRNPPAPPAPVTQAEEEDPSSPLSQEGAQHVKQAIAGLQREVLLLRNDLNFELWLSHENAKRIGKLYQDRILMKSAEAERQGLYNKLRAYRAKVQALERDLSDQKRIAVGAKLKYTEWNQELQKKLKELREEKKNWLKEAAALRNSEKEARSLFSAQSKLLADATTEVLDLKTQMKENRHKIERLRDYERLIISLESVNDERDAQFDKFKSREELIKDMHSQYQQMAIRLQSMEQTQQESEENARAQRHKIHTLEAQLKQVTEKAARNKGASEYDIAEFAADKARLQASNGRLREENEGLKDEVEALRVMVEVLKGRLSVE